MGHLAIHRAFQRRGIDVSGQLVRRWRIFWPNKFRQDSRLDELCLNLGQCLRSGDRRRDLRSYSELRHSSLVLRGFASDYECALRHGQKANARSGVPLMAPDRLAEPQIAKTRRDDLVIGNES